MDTSSPASPPKRRAKFLLGGSVVVIGVFALLFWAMTKPGSTAFYLTPTELQAAGPTQTGEAVRLNGTVVPGTIEESGLTTTFTLTDGSTEIGVTTDAAVPDTLKDRSEVVARGSYDGNGFAAVEVLAKCPSKFKPRENA